MMKFVRTLIDWPLGRRGAYVDWTCTAVLVGLSIVLWPHPVTLFTAFVAGFCLCAGLAVLQWETSRDQLVAELNRALDQRFDEARAEIKEQLSAEGDRHIVSRLFDGTMTRH